MTKLDNIVLTILCFLSVAAVPEYRKFYAFFQKYILIHMPSKYMQVPL